MSGNTGSIGRNRLETPFAHDGSSFEHSQYQFKTRFNALQLRFLARLKLSMHGMDLLLKLQQFSRHDTPLPFRPDARGRHVDPHIDPFKVRPSRLLESLGNGLHSKPKVFRIDDQHLSVVHKMKRAEVDQRRS